MKCNHCNTEVAEGTKFCPECGNRIEQPQPIKCPQCDTVVEEGVKFCPECGSPIATESKPITCSKCGTEIENGERFCSNCGTPVVGQKPIIHVSKSETHKHNANGSFVTFHWNEGGGFGSNSITVTVDGKQYGVFKHNEPFEFTVPISSSKMKVHLKYLYITTEFEIDLSPNQNYYCELQFSGGWMGSGVIGYELKDQNDNFVVTDGHVSFGAQILFLLIPLSGCIYFFMKKGTEPICAKVGLVWGLTNTLWCVLAFVFG
jgi:RNA polymerase subunit RPABC4/transcription elongation factor Spt4